MKKELVRIGLIVLLLITLSLIMNSLGGLSDWMERTLFDKNSAAAVIFGVTFPFVLLIILVLLIFLLWPHVKKFFKRIDERESETKR